MSVTATKTVPSGIVLPKTPLRSGGVLAAAARNKKRRKSRQRRKFKARTVEVVADKRWLPHHGYDKRRLAGRKDRAEKKPQEAGKKRKRSHRAIHNRRHTFFTESAGRHGIGINHTRLERHVRRMLERSQKEHAAILELEMRRQKVRVTPQFLQGIVAMTDALREKLIERIALFAACRQSGRSKSPSQKNSTNPSYMGMLQDLDMAWATIMKDAKM